MAAVRSRRTFGALLFALLAACKSGPRLVVVDLDADPQKLGGHPGALFELDLERRTLTPIFSSRELVDPIDLLEESDGTLLVLDLGGESGKGALWRIDLDSGSVLRVAASAPLARPTAIARAPDGSIWIADRGDGERLEPALLRLSPDLERCGTILRGAPLAAPAAIEFVDGQGLLLDADALRRDIAERSEGAIYRVDADGGKLALLHELKLVSPLSFAPWRGGFLVTDVNADPRDRRLLNGGVYRVDERGEVTPFASDRQWRDPSSGVIVGERLLVVDASSDPLAIGDDPVGKGFGAFGRGGVYAVDLETGKVSLVAATAQLVNPVKLVEIGGGGAR